MFNLINSVQNEARMAKEKDETNLISARQFF